MYCFLVVPGSVLNLTSRLALSYLVLKWRAPQQPNGVIISYQVTYWINGTIPVTRNTTNLDTMFVITSQAPPTELTDITVSAYTKVGRGQNTSIPNQILQQKGRKLFPRGAHV